MEIEAINSSQSKELPSTIKQASYFINLKASKDKIDLKKVIKS